MLYLDEPTILIVVSPRSKIKNNILGRARRTVHWHSGQIGKMYALSAHKSDKKGKITYA